MKQAMMKTAAAAFSMIILLASCSKNSNNSVTNTVVAVTVNNLMADTILGLAPGAPPTGGFPYASGKYTLYSLERNEVVPNTDSATNKWDVGFRGTTIITNSGNSGPGAGGGFVQVGLFADITAVSPDSTIKVDNAPTSYAITSGSNRGWYVYDAPNNLVTAIPGRVLIFRTATGKYAKMEILNYYKGGVTPAASASDADKLTKQRYYTFRYVYQSNGTKSFQ